MRLFWSYTTKKGGEFVPPVVQTGRQRLVHLSMNIDPDGKTAGVDLCGPQSSQRFRLNYHEAVEAADFFMRLTHTMRSRIACAPDFGRSLIDRLVARATRPSMNGTSFLTDRVTGEKLLIFQSDDAEPRAFRLRPEDFRILVAESDQTLSMNH